MIRFVFFAIVADVALLLGGCATIQVRNASHGLAFAETTIAVVPTGVTPTTRNYVVGYNAYGANPGRWSVSTDGGDTWTRHSEEDPGFSWGVPAEAPEGFRGYGVDPSLVLTGNPNQVAFVVIGKLAGGSLQVVIAVSTDGGVHFGQVHVVSSPADGTQVDEPVAALNRRTHDIWIAWTQKQPGRRMMLRKLHYDATGVLTFDTLPTEIRGLPGFGDIRATLNATIAAGTFHGQRHVALAYADKYETAGDCASPLDLNYYVADSIDDGKSWQVAKIAHDGSWPQCATDTPSAAPIYNRNRPAIAIANDFLVAVTQSSPTGSLVHLYRQDWPFDLSGPVELGSWPPADGKKHDQFGPALAVSYRADASVPDARVAAVALTWHDTRFDSTGGNVEELIYGVTSLAQNPFREGVISPFTGTVPNEKVPWMIQGSSQAVWGDYEGLAADDVNHSFIAAWADNRAGGDAEVWTAAFTPF